MVANGDGNRKIWATEYGQPSSAFSEANQAAYAGDFLRTWRTLEFAGPAFIHTLADYPSSSPIESSFGLFHQDWTPKPVLAVVEQVIAENEAIEAAADDNVLWISVSQAGLHLRHFRLSAHYLTSEKGMDGIT